MNENIVTNPIRLIGNSSLDVKNMPVNSVEELYAVPMNERYIGLTKLVLSEKKEYWLIDNISNSAWVAKSQAEGIIKITGSDVETV